MIGDSKNPGLYLLAAQDIFNSLKESKNSNKSLTVSYFEIYCGKLFDLLNNRQKLHAREDAKQNINVVGLKKFPIYDEKSLFEMINFGNSVRVTSTTGKNMDSSRSHAILQIYLNEGNQSKGLLSFIDLAGNERGADTYEHDSQTRIDGAEISKSLLALKECIRALDQDKRHVPFRGSKLTMVLKDSFIGDCKTVMIGNISPSIVNCEYSLNTLRYADRVKELKKDAKDRDKMGGNKELFLPRQANNVRQYEVREEPKGPQIISYNQKYEQQDGSKNYNPGNDSRENPRNYNAKSEPQEGSRGYNQGFEKPNLNVPTAYGNPFSNKNKQEPLIIERNRSNDSLSDNSNNYFSKGQQRSHSKYQPKSGNMDAFKQKDNSETELSNLTTQHENLINQILDEEDELLRMHSAHIKLMANLTMIVK